VLKLGALATWPAIRAGAMKMKALQFGGIGDLTLIETDIPRAGPGELLLRTGAAIICTSDVNELRSGIFGATLPIIFGHEGSGTVAGIGEEVRGFEPGDRVAAHPVHSCGRCSNCLDGMAHLCAQMRHFGLNIPGTFAAYFVVGADRARKVPRHIPFPVAALAEPVSVCLQALAQARVSPKSSLLIVGDGPFGILMSMLAKSMQIGRVVMTGEHDFRLAFSAADEKINIRKGQRAGGPFDSVILAVGNGPAAQEALTLLRPKGRLVIFSAVNDPTPIDLLSVHIKELEIVGACNDEDRFDEAVRRLVESPAEFGRIVTHQFAIEDFKAGFELAAKGHDRALKVAFKFENP
jgi:2-desacetyl-2-hydroxyethyl bacteriochlorophyllide A dehydrogenase